MKTIHVVLVVLVSAAVPAQVHLPSQFGDHMVLQRDRPVPVHGTAAPAEKLLVEFHGQSIAAVADPQGHWLVQLQPMAAEPVGQVMTITGSSTVTLRDVLVGDVWLCSGQSNMDMRLGDCKRQADIDSAELPLVRQFTMPVAASAVSTAEPREGLSWTVCSPATAASFSGVAFYFARKLQQDGAAAVPIGLILAAVGGSRIDAWLAPEGVCDLPVLQPLLAQSPLAVGTFSFFHGMVAPLAPFGIRGVLWYQGENAEATTQSPDSYYLKMKALARGWQRVFGSDDLAFYYLMIANWGKLPTDATPELRSGGWDADTRLQQAMALALPHAGMAVAIDIGDSSTGDRTWEGWHPKDKLDVGERLALWALKNEYGRADLVASGPILRDVAVLGSSVVCSFDHCGSGLMVGEKRWYQPTRAVPGGQLQRFAIAGADGVWHAALAVIAEDKVVLSSPAVAVPCKVSYACWQNPEGCNLYNREGLPAAPFHLEDVTLHHIITASAGSGGAIAPAGATSHLPGATVLYTIAPQRGHCIQDVQVDGVSVGSLRHYTFDPLRQDHTITARFATEVPRYAITTATNGGGTLSPAGPLRVEQGGTVCFTAAPEAGNRASWTLDGVAIGERERLCLCDVRADHRIAVTFACTIAAFSGYGGTVTPSGTVAVKHGDRQSFQIETLPGYRIAKVTVDGVEVGIAERHTFERVTASHTLAVRFVGTAHQQGRIPRAEELLFACRAAALPESGTIRAWPAHVPADRSFAAIGSPTVESLDGHRYADFRCETAAGFTVGAYDAPIDCQGASLVLVARPVRNGVHSSWTSLVDVFYDRLVLGIRADTGQVCVRRNGSMEDSQATIPDGQITILSLVVQPDGAYQVYANGTEIMTAPAADAMRRLVPGVAGPFAGQIAIGRNAPDGWTAFHGQIGDVLFYRTALTSAERRELEAYLADGLR